MMSSATMDTSLRCFYVIHLLFLGSMFDYIKHYCKHKLALQEISQEVKQGTREKSVCILFGLITLIMDFVIIGEVFSIMHTWGFLPIVFASASFVSIFCICAIMPLFSSDEVEDSPVNVSPSNLIRSNAMLYGLVTLFPPLSRTGESLAEDMALSVTSP